MTDLPEADAATRAVFVAWLERFAGYVREVDYASARPLFHPAVLAFGTHLDVIEGIDQWIAAQWDNVWPRTADFRFDIAGTRMLASDDARASGGAGMAVLVAPWTSTGFHQDGRRFDRPGRATLVFHKSAGAWLCVHSHMSLNRGVPQQSYADRPVKAG